VNKQTERQPNKVYEKHFYFNGQNRKSLHLKKIRFPFDRPANESLMTVYLWAHKKQSEAIHLQTEVTEKTELTEAFICGPL
jgi:hypothetical protein